jgi:DNA polymerase V
MASKKSREIIKQNSIKSDAIYSYDPEKKGPIIPFLSSLISAGFPSSAENYLEKSLDLNELLIKHSSSTFFIKVIGNSMINAGINSGDILIVDRALSVSNNKIIVARLNDEFTVKRILIKNEKMFLMADNENYPSIEITQDMDFEVWGIVTFVIHQF